MVSVALFKAALALGVARSLAAPTSSSSSSFGKVITSCTQPDMLALTFDDGPSSLTPSLLQKLNENNIKATFFMNGRNGQSGVVGGGVDATALLPQMLQNGHQIASHTMTHEYIDQLPEDQIRQQMVDLDNEIIKIIGKAPTFMRPPFYASSPKVLDVMTKMQYYVITSDIDTNDWKFATPETSGQALENLKQGLNNKGSIILMHDIHETTVNKLVPDAIPLLKNSGKKLVTVGECLGIPQEQWYREKSVTG